MSKKTNFFEGWRLDTDDWSRIEQIGPEMILQRFKTYWSLPGVVTGLIITPGPTTDSISITSGLGYDRDGQECFLPTVQTLSFPNVGAVTYYVRLTYQNTQVKGVYHSETGIGPDLNDPTVPYYVWLENGFSLSVVTAAPSSEEPDILLGTVVGSGTGTFVDAVNINMTDRARALIPQSSLQPLDHEQLENAGNLTHETLEQYLNQLFLSTGVTQGEVLTPSLLTRINTALSGNLDNLYVSKTSATYEGVVFKPNSNNTLEFNTGKVLYRGVIYPVSTSSSPLGPVTVGTPKMIVGTLTTGPNSCVISLETPSSGVDENQIVFGLYNGGDELFLKFGSANTLTATSLTSNTNKIKITDTSINSHLNNTVNKTLYLNNAQTTASVNVGNPTSGDLKLGSNSDTATVRMINSGETLIIAPRTSGTGNNIILSKPDGVTKTNNVIIRSESIHLNDLETRIDSLYPQNTIDFETTPGDYDSKTALLNEQINQLSIYDNLIIYADDGLVWDGGTETVTLDGGIRIVNFFTGAVLTANLLVNPVQLQNDYDILYVNWDLRSTTTKNIQVGVVNTPSFYIHPSVGENPTQDEYRLVICMRVPGISDPRLVSRVQNLLT